MLFDNSIFLLFAQQKDAQPGPFAPMLLVTVVAIMFLYMFIVQRPAMKKEQEARENLLKNLKKNDRILTSSGIFGVVTNLDAEEVTIRVDETTNTKIKITRSAVQKVLNGDAGGKEIAKEK